MIGLTDDQLAATCIADEAGNQPYEGKLAVARVILNRMAAKYESDGTVEGTVLKHFQFSGFWFSMVAGHYTQDEFDLAGAEAKALTFYKEFSKQDIWPDCVTAWFNANKKIYTNTGPEFAKITDRTLIYLNPKVSKAAWATPDLLDAVIFQHNFYHPA